MFFVNIYADGYYSVHSTAYGAEIHGGRTLIAQVCTARNITHTELDEIAKYYVKG